MAFEGSVLAYTMPSSATLTDTTPGTGHAYKAVSLVTGDIAGADAAGGILRFGGQTGDHITLDIFGVMKFTASHCIGAGTRVMCAASGYMSIATSGHNVCGRVLDSWVGSGAVGTGFFDFYAPYFLTTSN